jgi:hypothetical protein
MAGRFEQPFGKLLPRGTNGAHAECRRRRATPGHGGEAGVPAEQVHMEIFGTLESITPGTARVDHTPHLPSGSPGSGPSVSFARSGIRLPGIVSLVVCLNWRKHATFRPGGRGRTGVCDTCMTGLIGGSILYKPEPLEKPAPGNVLVVLLAARRGCQA